MANRIGVHLVSGTPADHLSASTPADWWAWIWTHIEPFIPPSHMRWIVGVLCAVALTIVFGRATLRALRSLGRLIRAQISARPIEDVLTIVAASIATGVSATGMWRFTEDVLHLPFALRVLLFAFIEVAIITSAVRARRNMRENFSAGIDGIAVWALTCLTAVLSSMDARSLPEAVFRLAAPLVAAWLWERGMAIERHRIRGTKGIHWRITPERILVLLGIAEATDRTAGEVDRARRLDRVAFAAVKADDLGEQARRRKRWAVRAFRKSLARAVEHANLATDEAAQQGVLDRIDALRSADALMHRRRTARWADAVTSENRAEAIAAIEQEQRFDSAEATQRALDKAALTLMALTENVTSAVTSERVTKEVTPRVSDEVMFVPADWTPATSTVTSPVSGPVTVELITNGVTFDITEEAAYDLNQMWAPPACVTRSLTPAVTAAGVIESVNQNTDEATKTKVMRAYWDDMVAQKVYPRPVELARHADADPGLASRLRTQWVDELTGWDKRRAKKALRDKASA